MSTLVRDMVDAALEKGYVNKVLYSDHIKRSLNGKNPVLKGDAPFIRPKDLISLGKEFLKVTGNVAQYDSDFLGTLGLLIMTQRTPKFTGSLFAQSVGCRMDKAEGTPLAKWVKESTLEGMIARIEQQAYKGKLLEDSASLPSIKKDKELVANNG